MRTPILALVLLSLLSLPAVAAAGPTQPTQPAPALCPAGKHDHQLPGDDQDDGIYRFGLERAAGIDG